MKYIFGKKNWKKVNFKKNWKPPLHKVFFGNDINFEKKKKNLIYFLKTYIKVGFFPIIFWNYIYIYIYDTSFQKKKETKKFRFLPKPLSFILKKCWHRFFGKWCGFGKKICVISGKTYLDMFIGFGEKNWICFPKPFFFLKLHQCEFFKNKSHVFYYKSLNGIICFLIVLFSYGIGVHVWMCVPNTFHECYVNAI